MTLRATGSQFYLHTTLCKCPWGLALSLKYSSRKPEALSHKIFFVVQQFSENNSSVFLLLCCVLLHYSPPVTGAVWVPQLLLLCAIPAVLWQLETDEVSYGHFCGTGRRSSRSGRDDTGQTKRARWPAAGNPAGGLTSARQTAARAPRKRPWAPAPPRYLRRKQQPRSHRLPAAILGVASAPEVTSARSGGRGGGAGGAGFPAWRMRSGRARVGLGGGGRAWPLVEGGSGASLRRRASRCPFRLRGEPLPPPRAAPAAIRPSR